jgi:hypothetical protein
MELDTGKFRYLVVWDLADNVDHATRRRMFLRLSKIMTELTSKGECVKLQRAVAAFTNKEDAEKIAQIFQPPNGDSIILELKPRGEVMSEIAQQYSHIHKFEMMPKVVFDLNTGKPTYLGGEQVEQERIIDFSEVSRFSGLLLECEPLTNRLGEQIEIASVDYTKIARYGEAAIITTRDKKKYYTFSKVILDQLRRIEDTLKNGYIVRARIVKKHRYLTLE